MTKLPLHLSSRGARSSMVLLTFVTAIPAWAQDAEDHKPSFSIEGSTRGRTEVIDGQFRPNVAADDVFVSFRTMVSAKVDIGAVTFGGEVVDARGYAQRKTSSVKTSEVNALEPVQAYVSVRAKDIAGGTATATAGRYALDIGSSRLVGRTDFPNTVQSYLGGMIDWRTKGKDRIVAFWSKPFSALPDDAAGIQDNGVVLDRAGKNVTFFGLSGTAAKAFGDVSLEGYVYRLAENDVSTRPTRNRHLVTVGSRIRQAPAKGKLDFEFEGALQRGHARAGTSATDRTDLDVRAGFAHAEAGYTFGKGWTPRISAVFDYASGDSKNAKTYGRFDTLFGARRADFGPVALYGPVGRANLISPGARIEVKPSKRFDMMAATRGLWLADATDSFASTSVRDRTGASGRYAGTQFEVRARRWLVPDRLRVEAGAAYLAKGKFLTVAPNAPKTGDTRYAYADVTFSF